MLVFIFIYQQYHVTMKFTFGPMHPFSILLYVMGLPLIFIGLMSRFFNWHLFDPSLGLQGFTLGIILCLIAAIINLSTHIINTIRSANR